jgi:hypothetical protein
MLQIRVHMLHYCKLLKCSTVFWEKYPLHLAGSYSGGHGSATEIRGNINLTQGK